MLVVTNFPHVPIATSNVATDLARTDNQQKPPIIPPQQPTKGHEERAFNPQNERAPAQVIQQKQQSAQQQSAQQQSTQQQAAQQALPQQAQLQAALVKPVVIKQPNNAPALSRKDVNNAMTRQASSKKSPAAPRQLNLQALAQQSDTTLAKLKQQVGAFYQQQTTPELPASFSAQV